MALRCLAVAWEPDMMTKLNQTASLANVGSPVHPARVRGQHVFHLLVRHRLKDNPAPFYRQVGNKLGEKLVHLLDFPSCQCRTVLLRKPFGVVTWMNHRSGAERREGSIKHLICYQKLP